MRDARSQASLFTRIRSRRSRRASSTGPCAHIASLSIHARTILPAIRVPVRPVQVPRGVFLSGPCIRYGHRLSSAQTMPRCRFRPEVAQNWRGAWLTTGAKQDGCASGGLTPGGISMIRWRSCSALVASSKDMSRRDLSSRTPSGRSSWMKQPPFRRVRTSIHLVLPIPTSVRPEARSHCRGAHHLFAGLSIANGRVYGTCRQRKRLAEFRLLSNR